MDLREIDGLWPVCAQEAVKQFIAIRKTVASGIYLGLTALATPISHLQQDSMIDIALYIMSLTIPTT